ncbi:MAG: hypothetical protein LBC96_04065 [Lachnospiraceae bacterium]|jgi:hypothetical protein|nr:hypothetical protein [Lachnospiraceae bacterium]
MSYHEIAKNMIDRLPNDKIVFLINIMENIGEISGIDINPEYEPNDDTLAAFAEGQEMLLCGTGQKFTSTKDLFAALEE